MDRATVSGTVNQGSTPCGSAFEDSAIIGIAQMLADKTADIAKKKIINVLRKSDFI